jgi:deoxyadenosine/deoxycytidine kinase
MAALATAVAVYEIMGMIGAGKTTLCRSAREHAGVAVFDEYVCDPFLRDYVGAPAQLGFAFQVAMLQSALVRTRAAAALASASGAAPLPGVHTLVVERPLQENMIFERANYLRGNLGAADHARYRDYAAAMFDDVADAAAGASADSAALAVLLWAPEAQTLQNMVARGRLGEDAYEDTYLQTLAHCYLLGTLALYLYTGIATAPVPVPVPASSWSQLRAPVVVDWSAFGTWDTLLREHLTPERRDWARAPGTVRIVVAAAGDAEVLDLGGYVASDGKGAAARAFRDRFFASRAHMTPLVLSIPDTRWLPVLLQVYADALVPTTHMAAPLALGGVPSPFVFSLQE